MDGRRLSTASSGFGTGGDREGLIHSYDDENGGFGLTDLTEDSDEERATPRPSMNGRLHSGHTQLKN